MVFLVRYTDKVNFMNQKKTKKYRPKNKPNQTLQSPTEQTQSQNQQKSQTSLYKKRKPNKKFRHSKQNPARAKAVREYSSGGIVFRVKDNLIEVVLLQDLKARWSIPKGHVESGETLEQTAIREIGEETGLTKIKIISKLDKIHFFYRMNNKLIFMTNFVYLIESYDHQEKLTPEDSEGIVDVQWFEAEQAYDVLEYKATKVILREAINRIKKRYNIK